MGQRGITGVDDAIALLLALADHDDARSVAPLLARTGIGRSSLHRIARTLETAGLVTCTRGRIAPGPMGGPIIAAHGRTVQFHASRQALRDPAGGQSLPARAVRPHSTPTPLVLSAPLPVRSRRRLRIGFSNASLGNPWRMALVHAIEFGAGALGDAVDWLAVRHADDNADRQCRDLDQLVAAGVDGLLVSAANSNAVVDRLADCVARGIAVVLVDRGGSKPFDHTSFVGGDDAEIGRITALWLAETLQGRGRLLILAGREDAAPARDRLAAAIVTFATFPGITIAQSNWTNWMPDRAYAIVSAQLAQNPLAFDGVWCDSGLQGVGSLQAYLAHGQGRVPPHTGGDLNLAYKLAMRHKVSLAAVDYPPSMGLVAVEMLFAALRGAYVPSRIRVRSDIILTRGAATPSVRSTLLAEDHVRWDLADNLILQAGLGQFYDPHSFRIRYPGNSYNRSAAQLAKTVPK